MVTEIKNIMNIEGLNRYLDEIGVSKEGDYLRDNFSQALMKFLFQEQSSVSNFIQGRISGTKICQQFIDFLCESKIECPFDKILRSLLPPDSEIDRAIKSMIPRSFHSDVINLFGFGLGSGYYEKDFANYLRTENFSKKINIFGYDPHSNQKDDAITYVTSDDLNKTIPKFDIFISRWALHHVKQNERWNTLIKFMNHVNSNGHIFIVEEGPYLLEKQVENERLYLLVQSLGDAFVNYVVFTDWLLSGNFHIEHLRKSDFAAIENSFTFKYQKEKMTLDVGIPTQTLVHYRTL